MQTVSLLAQSVFAGRKADFIIVGLKSIMPADGQRRLSHRDLKTREFHLHLTGK